MLWRRIVLDCRKCEPSVPYELCRVLQTLHYSSRSLKDINIIVTTTLDIDDFLMIFEFLLVKDNQNLNAIKGGNPSYIGSLTHIFLL